MNKNKDLLTLLKAKGFKNIVHCTEYLYIAGYPLKKALKIAEKLFPNVLYVEPKPFIEAYSSDYDMAANYFIRAINTSYITCYNNPLFLYWVKDNETIAELDFQDHLFWIKTGVIPKFIGTPHFDDYRPLIVEVLHKAYGLEGYKIRAF